MGDISAAQPRGLLDIMGNRGPEPPPETPPSGAAPVEPTPQPGTPPADERGIKAPQKRTFERVDEKGVKDFFSYRFDQLRDELKSAKASGDQVAIADVQRRMGELDQIQRQPRSLQDVMAGKPPKTSKDYENEITQASSVNSPAQAASYQNQAAQQLFGKNYDQLTDAQKIQTLSAGAKLQDAARAKKPSQSTSVDRRSLFDILSNKQPPKKGGK
jgi:hypothetical protein